MKDVDAKMISNYLIDHFSSEGLGVIGEDLFIGLVQEGKGNTITIFDEAGAVPQGGNDYDINVLGTQIITTGTYQWAQQTIMDIHRKTAGWYDLSLTPPVIDTHTQTTPSMIGYDDFNRAQFTVHYLHYCEIGNNEFRSKS